MEGTALAGFAFGPDVAVLDFGEFVAEGQAKAGARFAVGAGGGDGAGGQKEAGQDVGGNACAVIGDGDDSILVLQGMGNLNLTARR